MVSRCHRRSWRLPTSSPTRTSVSSAADRWRWAALSGTTVALLSRCCDCGRHPTRDHLSMLPDAIRALEQQLRPPDAAIVVDDGSIDGTTEWLRTLGHPWLGVVRTEGVGVSSARNVGLQRVETPWVVFLDDDDVPDADWLSTLVGLGADDDVGIVSCGARLRSESSESIRLPRPTGSGDRVALFLAGTYAVRRELLCSVNGFMDGLTWAENTELSIRLLAACENRGFRTAHVDRPLVTIRQREDRSSKQGRHAALLRVLDEHRDGFEPARRAKWLSIAGVDAFRAGDIGRARKSLRSAVSCASVAAFAGPLGAGNRSAARSGGLVPRRGSLSSAGRMSNQATFPVIVGCGRSGTTMLRAMLDASPVLHIPAGVALHPDGAEPTDGVRTTDLRWSARAGGAGDERALPELGIAGARGGPRMVGGPRCPHSRELDAGAVRPLGPPSRQADVRR